MYKRYIRISHIYIFGMDNLYDIWDIEDKIKKIRIFIKSLEESKNEGYEGIVKGMNEMIKEYEEEIKQIEGN